MSSKLFQWQKVERPEPVFMPFPSRRSVVFSTKGVVASSQPLATEAGLEILRKGGNAADAAVATSAALNVTEPCSCGIGGDAFCLYYDATSQTVKALNGSGRSPAKLTMEYAYQRGLSGQIPPTDINSVTVPGAAAAWFDTVDNFGNKKLSFAEVLEPAIRLAEEGVPVSELSSLAWQKAENLIKNASLYGDEMLLNGKAPFPGQVIKLPSLAQTFRVLANDGKNGFYKGRVAKAIVDLVQGKGGVMELEDLAKHESTFVNPISYTYGKEITIYECPPNGQGITSLIALGILECLQEQGRVKPLLEMGHNSSEYVHVLIEALRLAFADSGWYVTDPEREHVPVSELLRKSYLFARAELFNPIRKNHEIRHGNPISSSDTVYFSVTDQWGNACSYIQSNYTGFGTGAVPKGCGFTLQNRGTGFVLDYNHRNRLQGGKRPYHTIIRALVTRGKEFFLNFGVMGGYMQPQGHVQVLLNVLRGYSVQAALDAPRFCISAPLNDEDSDNANSPVYFEEGFPEESLTKLREMGHDVQKLSGFERGMMGRGQIIQKICDKSSGLVWAAGSDGRADGYAAAQI